MALTAVQAVRVELALRPDEDKIDDAVSAAAARCNISAASGSFQRVVLFDDVDALVETKMMWGWLIAASVALCWAPVGGLIGVIMCGYCASHARD